MEKLIIDKKSGNDIIVEVRDVKIGGPCKLFISGPCSVEDPDTMFKIAAELKAIGVHIIRGGAFKPRTSPYDFQGLQEQGLKILKDAAASVKLPIVTEVVDVRDIELVLRYADMIQVGARNMYNYSLLKELGRLKVPVLLKRGISATLKEWVYAAEYVVKEGNQKVVLCERGIRTFENYTRNTLDLNSVAVIKQKYRLPVLVDPSHGTGLRELVPGMSMAAVAAGADGLLIESHIYPEKSVSDARQTISMETLGEIYKKVKIYEGLNL